MNDDEMKNGRIERMVVMICFEDYREKYDK